MKFLLELTEIKILHKVHPKNGINDRCKKKKPFYQKIHTKNAPLLISFGHERP